MAVDNNNLNLVLSSSTSSSYSSSTKNNFLLFVTLHASFRSSVGRSDRTDLAYCGLDQLSVLTLYYRGCSPEGGN